MHALERFDPRPSIVVVRNSYDPDWHATVDGRRVPILPADYVDQGIPVPPGRHRILLAYHDPWIGLGLIGSGVSLAILLGLAVLLRRHGMGATRQDVLSSTSVEGSS